MQYTLKQCRRLMLEYRGFGYDWFNEIPRITKKEYDFHFLRGFIEGVFGW